MGSRGKLQGISDEAGATADVHSVASTGAKRNFVRSSELSLRSTSSGIRRRSIFCGLRLRPRSPPYGRSFVNVVPRGGSSVNGSQGEAATDLGR